MQYLIFELSEGDDGVAALEAMASTRAESSEAVMAEVRLVLDWAWREFPDGHGPVEEGGVWDHELLTQEEAGGWRTVTLTLSAAPVFVERFLSAFGEAEG